MLFAWCVGLSGVAFLIRPAYLRARIVDKLVLGRSVIRGGERSCA